MKIDFRHVIARSPYGRRGDLKTKTRLLLPPKGGIAMTKDDNTIYKTMQYGEAK